MSSSSTSNTFVVACAVTFATCRWPKYRSPRDRKSTRLNSSHSQISYAVFCLKKKKSKCPSPRPSADISSAHKRTGDDRPVYHAEDESRDECQACSRRPTRTHEIPVYAVAQRL